MGHPLSGDRSGKRTKDWALSLIHIFVCAGIEELDDGAGAFAGGEDEDGGRVLTGADALEEAEAVEAGQHEVEDDEVVTGVAGEVVAGDAVRGPIDSEAGAVAEGGGEVIGEAGFIFDQEDAHGGAF